MAFLNADLKPGIKIAIEAVRFEDIVKDADLVITGEGKIDAQTIYGKVPIGIAKIAKKYHVPVIAIAAIVEENPQMFKSYGIDIVSEIGTPQMRLDDPKSKKYILIKEYIKQLLEKNINILKRNNIPV